MTAEIALLCDRCERHWAHFPTTDPNAARRIARDNGWRCTPFDICPECVKEGDGSGD